MSTSKFRPAFSLSSLLLALLFVIANTSDYAWAVPLYSNDFETATGSEWSSTATTSTPIGGRVFLGEFSADVVTLTLNGLIPNSQVRLAFDLFLIRTWDGNDILFGPGVYGPDIFQVKVVSGPVLLHTTFANPSNPVSGDLQSYPDGFPGGAHPAATGAAEVNTLGYGNDTVYHIELDFLHSSGPLSINFEGIGLQGIPDESWGIDNVTVSSVPDGGQSMLLFIVSCIAILGIHSHLKRVSILTDVVCSRPSHERNRA